MSALEAALGDYLGLRRALGHKLEEHERQLTRFVARLDDASATFVAMSDTLAFVLDPDLDPASSNPAKRLMAVRGFTRYLSAIDPRNEVPPAGLVSYRRRRRAPHLFSDDDVAAVVRAARASTPFAFRAETVTSLIVLLAVTGMRVGRGPSPRLLRCRLGPGRHKGAQHQVRQGPRRGRVGFHHRRARRLQVSP